MAPGGFFSIIYSLERFLAKGIKKDIFFHNYQVQTVSQDLSMFQLFMNSSWLHVSIRISKHL